jgi:hypothetical protein
LGNRQTGSVLRFNQRRTHKDRDDGQDEEEDYEHLGFSFWHQVPLHGKNKAIPRLFVGVWTKPGGESSPIVTPWFPYGWFSDPTALDIAGVFSERSSLVDKSAIRNLARINHQKSTRITNSFQPLGFSHRKITVGRFWMEILRKARANNDRRFCQQALMS